MLSIFVRLGTICVIALGTVYSARASPTPSSFPAGTWQTDDGRARLRTERCGPGGTRLCGFVVWLQKRLDERGRPWVDNLNPAEEKRSRELLGHQVLLRLSLSEDGHYEGKIYNSEDGKTYEATVWQEGISELNVKGCLLVFCKTERWKRTLDVLPGELQGKTNLAGGPRLDPE